MQLLSGMVPLHLVGDDMQTLLFKRPDAAPRIRHRCPSCTEKHAGFPAIAYSLPDVVFALSRDERNQRAVTSSDLCVLDDERFFIRAVLQVPVADQAVGVEYGPWVEVSSTDFCRYAVGFNGAGHAGWFTAAGTLANAFPASESSTLGLACRVVAPDDEPKSRPRVKVQDEAHPLYADQANGISLSRATQTVSHMKGFMLLID
jgi:hypothetical protein